MGFFRGVAFSKTVMYNGIGKFSYLEKGWTSYMNRTDIVYAVADDMLKTAAEEILDSPLAKTASEEDINDAVAEKVAGYCYDAAALYKQAEEEAEAAEDQEEVAREALIEQGIDPDAVIEAAQEAAIEAAADQLEDDEEDEDEE